MKPLYPPYCLLSHIRMEGLSKTPNVTVVLVASMRSSEPFLYVTDDHLPMDSTISAAVSPAKSVVGQKDIVLRHMTGDSLQHDWNSGPPLHSGVGRGRSYGVVMVEYCPIWQ